MRRVIIMKKFKMVKKNIQLAIWDEIKAYRLAKANTHVFDEDDTKFKYWANKYHKAIEKYWEIKGR